MKKENLSIIISIIAIIISISSLSYAIYIGNNCDNSKCSNKEKPIGNNDECCNGCQCGDTIELLKNIESAWTLTEINSKGEYIYDRHSFINFHGTGKDAYAFFKNDENANPISEERGKFIINEKNEIILTPNNNKDDVITCTIGEEKDLIAVLHCDKDFGMFTLQKHGKIDLPSIIIDAVSKTKIIIVKEYQQLDEKAENYGYKEIKTITDAKEINKFITVINNSKVWTGVVTTPMPKYELELLDAQNNHIAKITYSPNFDIEVNDKIYQLTDIDGNSLNKIIK